MTANVRFGQEVFRSDQLKVLILDDEKPFTEELNEFFQHSGYKSFEANTWDEAQKIPETEKIDLLILDVRLPKVNGLDILKEVKRNLEVRNGNYKLRIANYKEIEKWEVEK
jgi:two-component system alkaline phosphatase synthesis response regulator PhoP